MQLTIILHTAKGSMQYWAKKNSDSGLMLAHINGGERRFYEGSLKDIIDLAALHGWNVEVPEEN